MTMLCCPPIIFSQWGGRVVGRATIQHNKKWLLPRQAAK
jgi:hypothetical protein